MSTALRIAVVFVLVLGNAVFVAAEYALVTARRSRLEERAESGGRGAKTALRLMDDPVRFISTVQVGITVKSGTITAVDVVQHPTGNHTDAEINDYALPVLVQDTLKAQSAKIDMVSGATVTSDGYVQSLQSALDQAGL